MKKFTSVFLAMVLTATVPAGFQAVYAEDTSAEDTQETKTNADNETVDQRPCQCNSLLFSTGKFIREGFVFDSKSNFLKYLRDTFTDYSCGTVDYSLGKRYILIYISVFQKTEVLKYYAQLTAVFGYSSVFHSFQTFTAYDDLAGCGIQLFHKKFDQGCFS